MALTRLGYALELVDLMDYSVFKQWQDKLLDTMNRDNMLTDNTLSVTEAIHAHDLLFKTMEVKTRHDGIRKQLSTGVFPLEKAMKEAMSSLTMERALEPKERPVQKNFDKPNTPPEKSHDGKSKSQIKKEKQIERATKALAAENAELKRKLSHGPPPPPPSGDWKPRGRKGKEKGKGKGKDAPLPEGLRDGKHQATSGDGRRICFGYNLKGCEHAAAGKQCKKGWHICSVKGCKGTHPASECDKK